MTVESSHHIDASEQGEDGLYEYYYEYDLYRFTAGGTILVARSYVDDAERVSFLGVEFGGERRLLTVGDLATPLFSESLRYLRAHGKRDFFWLRETGAPTYQPVEAAR